jgi:tetratricopeptide (TPR) repeat protein
VYSAARLEAVAAVQRGDFAEAERILAAEIERTGESDSLLGDLAQVRALALLGAKAPGSAAFDLAVAALDQAIARQPRSARLFALRGAVAARERRYADARADVERALALEPGDARVRLDAADLAAALRDFTAADRQYRAAISARPGDFDAWLARAIVLRARIDEGDAEGWSERYRAAHDALASAMNLDPSRIEVQYHFAVLLLDHAIGRAGASTEVMLLLVRDLLRRFIAEAATKPALAQELTRARQMYSDIQAATTCNFGQTAAERKAAEVEARQRAAEDEAIGGGALDPLQVR